MFQGLTGHDDMPVTRLLQCQCQGTTKMDRTEAGRSEDCTSTDCAGRTRMEERCGVFKDREAAQCYIDVGGEDEVTVTSSLQSHPST